MGVDRAYHRARYQELKSAGLCPGCKGEVSGRVYCAPCGGRINASEYREARAAWARRVREERIAEGTCAKCGKAPADVTRNCKPCAGKLRAATAKRNPCRRQTVRCSICADTGHNRTSCPRKYTHDIEIVTHRQ